MCRSRNLFLLSLSAAQLGKCSAFIATTTTSTLHHVRRGSISAKSTVLQSALFSIAPTATDIATKSSSVLSPSVVLERVFEDDNRPIILFDGVCNLCNNAVNLALDWDPHGRLRFAALQSNVGKSLLQSHGRDADDISSIVFVTQNGAYIKSDAILGITEELNPLPMLPLKPFAKLATNVIPQFVRDLIYDGVITMEEYQRLLTNIGAMNKMSQEDLDEIFSELGDDELDGEKVISVKSIEERWEPFLHSLK